MLMKLFDEVFSIIGAMIAFLVLIIGLAVAYYYFPITTCVIGGMLALGWLADMLSEKQQEWLGVALAFGLLLTAIGFAFYYFPKITAVICATVCALIALGSIVERIEKRKAKKATS